MAKEEHSGLIIHPFQKRLIVAGLDEAGRGCLAGPVVCASVILPLDYHNSKLNDSKKLSKKKREEIYEDVINNAIAYQIEAVDNTIVDDINVFQATLYGWTQCISNMKIGPEYLLVDGKYFVQDYSVPHECVIGGDATYLNIAAASVLAKVHKDAVMAEMHEEYPMYNWIQNSAYGTKEHKAAIRKHGLSPYHRTTYKIKL